MSKVRKILPVSTADISGLEKWLEEQENSGLFPVSIGSWGGPLRPTGRNPATRFPFRNHTGKCGGFSHRRAKYLCIAIAGWGILPFCHWAQAIIFLFYTTDPSAV